MCARQTLLLIRDGLFYTENIQKERYGRNKYVEQQMYEQLNTQNTNLLAIRQPRDQNNAGSLCVTA